MRTLQKVFYAVAATAVAACGGGGGGDSTLAGINGGGRWVAQGSITGFGSVIVNGVRFDTTAAAITVDGNATAESSLATGMIVRVEGEADIGVLGGRALAVTHETSIRGTVQQVSASAGRLTVMGQPVSVSPETVLVGVGIGAGVEGISPGQTVSVSGFRNAAGGFVASRIAVIASGTGFEVMGSVGLVEPASQRFRINDLIVDYSTAMLQDFGGREPEPGDVVAVRGMAFAQGVLTATTVIRRVSGISAQAGDTIDLEGFITRFASTNAFDISGQRVVTNAATQYVRGNAQNLAADVFVDVRGQYNAAGELAAARIEFLPVSNVLIEATLEGVNPATGVLTLLGIEVTTTLRTRFVDDDDRPFGIADLRTGDSLEIAGYVEAGRLTATRVSRDDDDDGEVEIEGPVTDLAAPTFRVGTVLIATDSRTEFEGDDGSISAVEFFATAAGRIVEVEGQWNGVAVLAEEVEFED